MLQDKANILMPAAACFASTGQANGIRVSQLAVHWRHTQLVEGAAQFILSVHAQQIAFAGRNNA